jgi:hypothetical protein
MTVKTHIDQARTRVKAEQDTVDAKLTAFETFIDRVSDLPTEPTASRSPGITAIGGAQLHADSSADDRCRAVRRAFDETVRPHSVADGDDSQSLLATIQSEFTDSIAVALASPTGASFSPDLKRMIIEEANARKTETDVLGRALAREKTQLENAGDTVADIADWIAEADETPLIDLGFEALRRRHETLAGHRDRCEKLAHRRQEFLRKTTSKNAEAGITHRSLVPYLYRDLPIDHPVLATVTRLDAVCEECQRAVRDHLVRRV